MIFIYFFTIFLIFSIKIIKQKELLSNKSVHLFLQSTLSISIIRDNVEGRRNDEVITDLRHVITDKQKNISGGFWIFIWRKRRAFWTDSPTKPTSAARSSPIAFAITDDTS